MFARRSTRCVRGLPPVLYLSIYLSIFAASGARARPRHPFDAGHPRHTVGMGDVSLLEMRMEGQSLLDSGESSASKYNSRVGRARLANQNARKQAQPPPTFPLPVSPPPPAPTPPPTPTPPPSSPPSPSLLPRFSRPMPQPAQPATPPLPFQCSAPRHCQRAYDRCRRPSSTHIP